ncbi:DNA-directed RNA polymerase subunit K [Methanocaldococcus indicus]|uniref:DNA-directed RNA polymerase subunit K n=1 Tax=Methanocaldococcus indicus TaxID=213231 RepID=UPI003C6D2026
MEKLTKFEVARILGARSLQISEGAYALVDVKDSALKIAFKELEEKKAPLKPIRRRKIEG